MRIVSLLPAATEIVCALGLRDRLVARSHECDEPPDVQVLPALTRARLDSSLSSRHIDDQVRRVLAEGLPLYVLDEDRLASLAPDVVVTQAACDVCAISLSQVEASVRRTVPAAQVVCLTPTRLNHIMDDIARVAAASSAEERGRDLISRLRDRLARAAWVPPAPRPRVAVVEWLSPPMLAGHWTPEAIEAAGGLPLGPDPGTASRYSTWDDVRTLRPDAIVVAPCGFDLARTSAEAAPLLGTLRSLAPRLLLMDGNAYLNRPGPRVVEAIETLAAWFRGQPLPTPLARDASTDRARVITA